MNDYLHDYFIPKLMGSLELIVKASSHCCGLCKHWNKYDDSSSYGECNLGIEEHLGFDCSVGKTCPMFYPSIEISVSLGVHHKDKEAVE